MTRDIPGIIMAATTTSLASCDADIESPVNMSSSQLSVDKKPSKSEADASTLGQRTDAKITPANLHNNTLARPTKRRLSNQSQITVSEASRGSESVVAFEREAYVQTPDSRYCRARKARTLLASLVRRLRRQRKENKSPRPRPAVRDQIRISVQLSSAKSAPSTSALVDSGASVSVVSHEFTTRAGIQFGTTDIVLLVADSRPLSTRGEFMSEVHFKDDGGIAGCTVERFIVVDDIVDEIVLGYPWLRRVNPSFDWTMGTWRLPRVWASMIPEQLSELEQKLLDQEKEMSALKAELRKAKSRAREAEVRALEKVECYHEKVADAEECGLQRATQYLEKGAQLWKRENRARLDNLNARERKLSIGERDLANSRKLLDQDRLALERRSRAMESVEKALMEWKLSSAVERDAASG